MASSLAFSPAVKPPAQLSLVSSPPVRFDAEFLERRMRAHRQWQNRVAEETTREILAEVSDALDDARRLNRDASKPTGAQ
jgi:hypothetical protein